MAITSVNFIFNKKAIESRVRTFGKIGTTEITNEFIKDANYHCRKDSGNLIRSAIANSHPEKGLAIWRTPYARRVYYTGTPGRDSNPNASLLWGEKAKAENLAKYKRMLEKLVKREV